MAEAVEAGKVRAVGVSNYRAPNRCAPAHAELARRGIPLASNHVQYSLLHRNPETDGVLDACRELGVTLIAYMPLASGALTGKYSASYPAGRVATLHRLLPRQEPRDPLSWAWSNWLREIGSPPPQEAPARLPCGG